MLSMCVHLLSHPSATQYSTHPARYQTYSIQQRDEVTELSSDFIKEMYIKALDLHSLVAHSATGSQQEMNIRPGFVLCPATSPKSTSATLLVLNTAIRSQGCTVRFISDIVTSLLDAEY